MALMITRIGCERALEGVLRTLEKVWRVPKGTVKERGIEVCG